MKVELKKGYGGCYGDLDTEVTLPELTGTPAQVSWAASIREATVLGYFRRLVESPMRAAQMGPEQVARATAQLQAVLNLATSAAEWIDERDGQGPGAWLPRIAKRHESALRAAAPAAVG